MGTGRTTVDVLAKAVEEQYLDRALGAQVAQRVRSEGVAHWQALSDAELCARATAVMQDVTGDLHLRVVHHPDGTPEFDVPEDFERHWTQVATSTAGGIMKVERLPSNVAVLTLGPFLGLPTHTRSWIVAAMALCRGANALVIDVRECVGGTPDSTALICSHVLGPQPVHLMDVTDAAGLHQFWTQPLMAVERVPTDLPIAVLTSARTFSGGEEIAFVLQELARARVVGERTKGGAHPRVGVKITDHLELALPVARPSSPRSGGNWEGVGVAPDISCTAESAFDRAVSEVLGAVDRRRTQA